MKDLNIIKAQNFKWFTPESSMIKRFGYNKDEKILRVIFNNKAVFDYSDVKPGQFLRMQISVSAGKYFNKRVKGLKDEVKIKDGKKKSKK